MTQFDDQFSNGGYEGYGEPRQSNPLGVVGFVLSLLCITSPIGLLLSMIALLKAPRGFAIAGTIIGLLFTSVIGIVAFFAVVYGSFVVDSTKLTLDLERLRIEAREYVDQNQAVPASLDELGWDDTTDPWGHEYVFSMDSETNVWELRSVGPDGVADTGDDFAFDSTMEQSDVMELIKDWADANAKDVYGFNP
ncbi:unnamed protein product [Symbiodinium necroappetens]|uniref:Type II secretion system protein GspG C-terminal domain-containing protein n=1 Tax=Symbiodinium necroappetens TaxID=1628268 RepID=A0A812RP17_9DINO|nr:unnamed protein product [Symbiodinium necroappetens]